VPTRHDSTTRTPQQQRARDIITGVVIVLAVALVVAIVVILTRSGSDDKASPVTVSSPSPSISTSATPTPSPTPAQTASPTPSPSTTPTRQISPKADPDILKKIEAGSQTKLDRKCGKRDLTTVGKILYPASRARLDGDNTIFPKVAFVCLPAGYQARWLNELDEIYPTNQNAPSFDGSIATFEYQGVGEDGKTITDITLMVVIGDKSCLAYLDANATRDGFNRLSLQRWGCTVVDVVTGVMSKRDGKVTDTTDHYAVG
jgi:hypothetical protein